MKLIIQVPCYNEQLALAVTLAVLPRRVAGVDVVEWLIVDDGSADDTIAVARAHGVDHIIRHPVNLGLAKAFMTGLSACLDRGADIIVNTDADNQYHAGDIPVLIAPILAGRADITIGARPVAAIRHFSRSKKLLQRFGSWVVRRVSGLDVDDAPSGFRAYSRDAARRMNVFNRYTYTLETIIQAGQSGIAVESVPDYVGRSLVTILRIFITYRPLRTFIAIGSLFLLLGIAIGVRFLIHFVAGQGSGHIQSLILAAIFSVVGFQLWVLGVIADIISVNRRLLEDIQHRVRGLPTTTDSWRDSHPSGHGPP